MLMKLFGKILANKINIYTFAEKFDTENLKNFCLIRKKICIGH